MADASDLFRLAASPKDPVADASAPPESRRLPPPLLWSSASSALSAGGPTDPDPSAPVFSFAPPFPDAGSDFSDDEDDDLYLSLDLFCGRRSPCSSVSGASVDPFSDPLPPPVFSVCDGLEEIETPSALGLRLGLGLGFEQGEVEDAGNDAEREVVVPGWAADDFFVGRRSTPSESIEFSRARAVDFGGLRVASLDSDSDTDEQIVALGMYSDDGDEQYRVPDDLGLPLCWDSLQSRDVRGDANEEFEWEEIEGQRDGHSVMVVGNGEASDEMRGLNSVEVMHENSVRNIHWEVILAMDNIDRNPFEPEYIENYFDDHEDIVYTSNHDSFEALLGQLADQDDDIKGGPPAAKSVIENLPSVVLTKEESADIDTVCAVCKDGITVEERVKRLPCFHHYHDECILPWLVMRNTCPLCRFELPTDDPEYEKHKARRAGSIVSTEEALV